MKPKRHRSPKIFNDNPGTHFDPYFDKKTSERRAHERGVENKIRWNMGERGRKLKLLKEGIVTVPTSRAPVTLATLKWMKNP